MLSKESDVHNFQVLILVKNVKVAKTRIIYSIYTCTIIVPGLVVSVLEYRTRKLI